MGGIGCSTIVQILEEKPPRWGLAKSWLVPLKGPFDLCVSCLRADLSSWLSCVTHTPLHMSFPCPGPAATWKNSRLISLAKKRVLT